MAQEASKGLNLESNPPRGSLFTLPRLQPIYHSGRIYQEDLQDPDQPHLEGGLHKYDEMQENLTVSDPRSTLFRPINGEEQITKNNSPYLPRLGQGSSSYHIRDNNSMFKSINVVRIIFLPAH